MSDLTQTFEPMATPVVPSVEERIQGQITRYDVFSRLLKERQVFFEGPVMDQQATLLCAQLLWLEAEDPSEPITLIINSPGGSITAGMAIFDTIRKLKCPVQTLGNGMCASMGSFLLSAGTPGHRLATPNTTVMFHQPRTQGGGQGVETSTDKKQNSKLIDQTRRRMEAYYAAFMGVPYNDEFRKLIHHAMEQDTFVNPVLAKELGMIDEIIMPEGWENDPAKKLEFDNLLITQQMDLEDALNEEYPNDDPLNAALALRDARNKYLEANGPVAPANDTGSAPAVPAPGQG